MCVSCSHWVCIFANHGDVPGLLFPRGIAIIWIKKEQRSQPFFHQHEITAFPKYFKLCSSAWQMIADVATSFPRFHVYFMAVDLSSPLVIQLQRKDVSPRSITQHKHRVVISPSFLRTLYSAVSEGKQWLWLMSCCRQRPNNFDLELLSVTSFHKSATDTAIHIMDTRESTRRCMFRELPLSRCSQTPKVMFWLEKNRDKFLLIDTGVFKRQHTEQ